MIQHSRPSSKHSKVFYLFLVLIALNGCTYFGTSHQHFVESMDNYIKGNVLGAKQDAHGHYVTIRQLSDPDFAPGIAEKKDLVTIKKLHNGNYEYHYAKPNLWKRYCYYYIVVEKHSGKVIDWGFDYKKGNPKKDCGISG